MTEDQKFSKISPAAGSLLYYIQTNLIWENLAPNKLIFCYYAGKVIQIRPMIEKSQNIIMTQWETFSGTRVAIFCHSLLQKWTLKVP